MPRVARESRTVKATCLDDSHSKRRSAFTLVELLVVVVIIMVLSGLMLAGLATARRGAKIDRTKSTIRKIHEIVMPQYETYLRRRAPPATLSSAIDRLTMARDRLSWVRLLMVREMPDTWSDVPANPAAVNGLPLSFRTGPVYAYAAARAAGASAGNGGAECLFLIASRGPGEPDEMERFRTEEIGDTDGDGAPEFLDAWGRPIEFIRWAPGYSASPGTPGVRSAPLIPAANGVSVVQFADPANFHDPLDPMRQDPAGYALIPLVVSAGPDGDPGLQMSNGWSTATLFSIVGSTYGSPDASGAHTDNITNHDLSKK